MNIIKANYDHIQARIDELEEQRSTMIMNLASVYAELARLRFLFDALMSTDRLEKKNGTDS